MKYNLPHCILCPKCLEDTDGDSFYPSNPDCSNIPPVTWSQRASFWQLQIPSHFGPKNPPGHGLSQSAPRQPSVQLHAPPTWSQDAPFLHKQAIAQPGP